MKKPKPLNQTRAPYATATIVRRKIPSSGKPGDKAIITKDGQIHGWIGGGCTRGDCVEGILIGNAGSKTSDGINLTWSSR